MVTQAEPEKRDDAEYSLDAVHRLAKASSVVLESRRVLRHVENLQYGIDDVNRLLQCLRRDHFLHAERYVDDQRWHDVYRLPHPVALNPNEHLYIKFRLNRDCIVIQLCSFHPEGWV
jgi:hypothetical protein